MKAEMAKKRMRNRMMAMSNQPDYNVQPRRLGERLDKELLIAFKDDPVLGARKSPIRFPDRVTATPTPPVAFTRFDSVIDRSLVYSVVFLSGKSDDADPDKYTIEYIERFLQIIRYQEFGGYVSSVTSINGIQLLRNGPQYDGFVIVVVDSQDLY